MEDGRDDHDKNLVDCGGGDDDHLRDGRNLGSPAEQVVDGGLSTQTIAQRGLSDGYGNSNTSSNSNSNNNININNARRRTSGSKINGNINNVHNNLIGKKAFEQDFMLSTLKGVANALKSSHRNSLKQSLSSPSRNHRRPTSAISTASTPPVSSSSTSSSNASTPNSHIHRHSTPSNNGVDLELVSNCSTSSSVSSNLSSSNGMNIGGGSGVGVDQGNISARSSISNNNFNVAMSSDHLNMLESMRFDQTSDIESIKKDLIKICRENRLEILAHYVSQIG